MVLLVETTCLACSCINLLLTEFEGRTVTYGPPLFHFTLWIEVEKQVVSPTSEFANVEVDSPTNVEQIRLHTLLCVSRWCFDSFRHFPRKTHQLVTSKLLKMTDEV